MSFLIQMDRELERRVRAEATRRNQPLAWFVRLLLEKELWPDKPETGLHPVVKEEKAKRS